MNASGAVLDANVLIPASLRDVLLRAAAAGLYRVQWSDDILAEVERNLAAHGMTTAAQAQRLIGMMRRAFPDASISGRRYQRLKAVMPNDPKDRHVLAAAAASNVRFIVTNNLRHFPSRVLATYSIDAVHPDAFLAGLHAEDASLVSTIVQQQAADLHAPPRTVDDVLDTLARHVPGFVVLVRQTMK